MTKCFEKLSTLRTLGLKNCPAILCRGNADYLHYLYITVTDFFETEKRYLNHELVRDVTYLSFNRIYNWW